MPAYILCAMLGVQEVNAVLRTRRLRWFGHIARSSSCTNSITRMAIPSARRNGRPKQTWSECVKADIKMCSLDPLNREAWGFGVRHSSSHLLPTPVPGTPTAIEKINSGSSQGKLSQVRLSSACVSVKSTKSHICALYE